MMLGVGKAAEADPCAIPAGSDGLQAGMSFDVSGRRSIDPEELVQLLRHRFFNVLLVDVTTESSEPQLVLKHMDPPAPGTVSKLQPQEPSAFIASTMDKSRDLAPIVGSRRFASLVKIRNLVRYVSSAQLAEYERRKASLESKGNQDTLDGDATAVDLETGRGINGVDGSSSPSSRQKKRDSGVDLRDQSESGAEDSDASDCDDDDMEPMDVGGRLEELDDSTGLKSKINAADTVHQSELVVHPEDVDYLKHLLYRASQETMDPHWQRRLHGVTVIIDEYGTGGGFAHRLSESLSQQIADIYSPTHGSLIGDHEQESREDVTCPRCSEAQQDATGCLFESDEACRSHCGADADDTSLPSPPRSSFRSAMSFSVAHFSSGQPICLYLSGGLQAFRRLYPQMCLDFPCPRMESIRAHQDQLVDAVWYGKLPGGHANDHPVEIVPHLYLGSAHAALPEHLEAYSIGLVIRLGSFSLLSKRDGVEYVDLEIDDAVGVRIGALFGNVCQIIAKRIARGVNVLVHCHAGVSRSATIVLAYLLMQSSGRFGTVPLCDCHHELDAAVFKDLRSAFHYVFIRRPIVRPNEGFCRQLQSLEMALFGTEETSMPRWWMYASYLYGTDWIEHALRDEELLHLEQGIPYGYDSGSDDGTSIGSELERAYRLADHGAGSVAITLRYSADATMTDASGDALH